MAKMQAPKGASLIKLDGVDYVVDASGHVTVPDELEGALYQYGYTRPQPAPVAPTEKSEKKHKDD